MNLLANKSGHRKILWPQLLKISMIMVPLAVGACSLGYLVLAGGRWNPLAAWLGLAGGFAIVLVILVINLFTPINRLPFVR